jgi:hypothetical protein
MLFAPLVAVAFVIAIPLWPVALAVLLVLNVVAWLLEGLCRLLHITAFVGAGRTTWRWLVWMAKPLSWFDVKARPDELQKK